MVMRRLLVGLCLMSIVSGGAATARTQGTTHEVYTAASAYAPGDARFADTPAITIFRGDSLRHTNLDADLHDLMAVSNGPDGQPWFDSPLIGRNETAMVPVENVPPGTYSFTCSIHPFMAGRLTIRNRPPVPEPVVPPDVTVSSGDSFFAPKTMTVPTGTTVGWKNDGAIDHSVTAADGSWDSNPACPAAGCWRPGQTYAHTFNAPGTYPYYCKLHGTPAGTGHAGTVIVVPPGSTPTAVSSLQATTSGNQVSVSGLASFHGEAPVTISEDPSGDGPIAPDLADDTGVDLVKATAYRPNPDSNSIFFEWHLTGLPDSGSLPEAVRYTLPFKIGTSQFQLQAKLSNVGSVTAADDPQGHATHLDNAFQLRGNCTANWPQAPVPLGNCPHLAWLGGSFDTDRGIVRIKLPVGLRSELQPGAVLQRNTNTNTSLVRIQATYQALVSQGTTTGDEAEWGGDDAAFTYRIPGKTVAIGIAPAGAPASSVTFPASGTIGGGDAFTGSVTTPGPGSWDVWVKACFGTNCGIRSTRVTV